MKRMVCLIISVFIFTALAWATESLPIETRGGKVKVVKYAHGAWRLFVDEKPYFIKGVVFNPVKIGEDPGCATMRDWTYYDDDHNGKNDIAFQTWMDTNKNNIKDPQEKEIGDFELLKQMGCNTIRLYHVASDNPLLENIYKTNAGAALQFDHAVNKILLRSLYKDYGIRVIMGNFLGAWTIGSGASWDEGTDYTNPLHCVHIKQSVKAMVLDNKDEPYVLFWLLGNENNIASWSHCNAKIKSEAYARLVGEIAEMIHALDPDHPVAICDGDDGILNMLKQYALYAQSIDIIGLNSYRGINGYGFLWRQIPRIFDRPVFISESGVFAYQRAKGEDEDFQAEYIKSYWTDVVHNSAEYYNPSKKYMGNAIGMVVFDWVDRWYMDGSPYTQDEGKRFWEGPDKVSHEEWFGIMSMGMGSDSLMRRPRKAYYYLKDVWNKKKLTY